MVLHLGDDFGDQGHNLATRHLGFGDLVVIPQSCHLHIPHNEQRHQQNRGHCSHFDGHAKALHERNARCQPLADLEIFKLRIHGGVKTSIEPSKNNLRQILTRQPALRNTQ